MSRGEWRPWSPWVFDPPGWMAPILIPAALGMWAWMAVNRLFGRRP